MSQCRQAPSVWREWQCEPTQSATMLAGLSQQSVARIMKHKPPSESGSTVKPVYSTAFITQLENHVDEDYRAPFVQPPRSHKSRRESGAGANDST